MGDTEISDWPYKMLNNLKKQVHILEVENFLHK